MTRISRFVLALALLTGVSFVSSSTTSAENDFQEAFAGSGYVTYDVASGYDTAQSVAVDAEGRLLVASQFDNGGDGDFGVIRLLSDGSLDLSFGTLGRRSVDFGDIESLYDMAVDAEGRIVLVGTTQVLGSYRKIAVARLTADGELDLDFDSDGKKTVDLGSTATALAVSVETDGQITIAGYKGSLVTPQIMVLRLTESGAVAPTFNSGNPVVETEPNYSLAYEVLVQSDGKILVVGGTGDQLSVHRYNSDGSLDTAFGTSGRLLRRVGDFSSGRSAEFDSVGRVVIALLAEIDGDDDFAAVRMNSDGSWDDTFGSNGGFSYDFDDETDWVTSIAVDDADGVVLTGRASVDGDDDLGAVRLDATGSLVWAKSVDHGDLVDNEAQSVAFDNEGRIVFGGCWTCDSLVGADIAVTRLLSDGSLDEAFGAGWVTASIATGTDDDPYATTIDSLGRIVVVGSSVSATDESDDDDIAIMRFTSEGVVDSTFGTNGRVVTDIQGDDDHGFAVATDSRGRIVVVGQAGSSSGDDIVAVRYLSTGALDPSFDNDGIVVIDRSQRDEGWGVAIDASDRVIVAGVDYNNGQFDMLIARLTTTGELDSSFGTNGVVVVDGGVESDTASDVMLDSSGRILVAGLMTTAPFAAECAVIRLTTTGALDTSFGNGGIASTDFGSNANDCQDLDVDASGRVLVAGSVDVENSADVAAARFLADGTLDTSFASEGVFVFDHIGYDGDDNFVWGVGISATPDGRVVLASQSSEGLFGTSEIGLVQVLDNDGNFVESFGDGGTTAFGFAISKSFQPVFGLRGLVLDGRDPVVVGSVFTRGSNRFGIAKFDGSVPPSAPSGVGVVEGDGELVVSWLASADDGGSPVTGYVASTSSGESCSTTGLSCTISGLTNGVEYSVSVTASNVIGESLPSVAVTGTPAGSGAFVALTPKRLLDTRSGDMVGELDGSGAAYELQVTGVGGVPSSGVSAVALNVTAVSTETNDFGGFVTVYPCGTRPDASNLNFTSGQTIPNSVIAPVSADGKVCFYVYGKAHLLADVSGYFPSGFEALTPKRLLDTRSGDKVGDLDGSGSAYELQVTGKGGVPSSGVSAVALNVTAVSTETNDFGGFVTVYPCGTRPDASNLNFTSGQTIPNSVIAPVSSSGKVCFYVYGKAHLLADVSGYFPSGFDALTPKRLLDTRSGDKVGELDGSGSAYELQVTGQGGVPSSGVSAVALNVTAVSTETNDFGGFVTVYPCGTRPDASNLNFTSGMTIPNSVIAPVSDSGKVCFYVYGKTHLLADVSGYFPN